jgi:tRNA(fMet)-specific endonuclease VapC
MRILDTNTVSSLMRHDPRSVARLGALQPSEVAAPEPVFAEIAYGIARLPKSKRRARLETDLERVREAIPTASWTEAVSDAFGVIKAALERAGRRLEDFDLAIAAHAVAHGAVLVTSNVDQMSRIADLEIEDWTAED